MLELAVAAWMAWQRGIDFAGNAFTVDDPLAARTGAIWAQTKDIDETCSKLLAMGEVFGDAAQHWPELGPRICALLRRLVEQGPGPLMAEMAGMR
jgi:fructuronate reductase